MRRLAVILLFVIRALYQVSLSVGGILFINLVMVVEIEKADFGSDYFVKKNERASHVNTAITPELIA